MCYGGYNATDGEAFWIMHFSPLDPYVTGLLMTILLYVLSI